MIQKVRTSENIVRLLREKGPKNLTTISRDLGLSPSTISYHVQRLLQKEVLAVNESKVYRVAEEGDVEKAILGVVQNCGAIDKNTLLNSEKVSVFGTKAEKALEQLILKGLVEQRDSKLSLTRWGAKELNVCLVCYKKVSGVSVGAFVEEILYAIEGIRALSWGPFSVTDLLVHPGCFGELVAEILEEPMIPRGCFCDYCGLPLSPSVLLDILGPSLTFEDLRPHFLRVEDEALRETRFRLSLPVFRRQDITEAVEKVSEVTEQKGVDYRAEKREEELWEVAWSMIRNREQRNGIILQELFLPIGRAYSEIPTPWKYTTENHVIETTIAVKVGEEKKNEIWKYLAHGGGYSFLFSDSEGKRFHPYCWILLRTMSSEALVKSKEARNYGYAGMPKEG